MEIFNNLQNEEIFKDFQPKKEKTFLNKKRNISKDAIDTPDYIPDEILEECSNDFTTNSHPKNLSSKDQSNQIKEFELIEKKTNLPTKYSCLELPKINQNSEKNIKTNDENQNNIDTNIFTNCQLKTENDLNTNSNDAFIDNFSYLNRQNNDIQKIYNKKYENNKKETYIEKGIELKEKNDLVCLALDLLKENGEFQIKLSKTSDSAYFLKIKEVEIKDNYYEQLKYAKRNKNNSYLKYTVPNNKFWLQRYYYFSKFDQGIKMDKESWYSVTPEEIAKYTAKLIEGKTIIDGFCGCGGNVIQFSKYCSKVYAIDICPNKLDLCKNNCDVYHCKNNIEFIQSDFLKMKNKIKADYIFLSPPWGGTEYKNSEIYSIKKFMYPDITEIIRVSLNVADNILFFLPRNLDLDELFDICSQVKNEIKEGSGKNLFFDIRIIKSNGKIKSLLIIFGHHIKDSFSKHKLEKFLEKKYEKIDEKNINILYSKIKNIGLYRFFREEYIYRTMKSKGVELFYLIEYINSILDGT